MIFTSSFRTTDSCGGHCPVGAELTPGTLETPTDT
jgi:hypothetical protein